ncbi:cuticle protein 2-like [Cimex lectularius]|uniref:CPR type cuticle protein n=1 Tax=Cimex lectularius TaxID=79782 RepID=A0A8I6RKH9_CIMLE|nr:cuticle protein 2-like [Cimex lectularius]
MKSVYVFCGLLGLCLARVPLSSSDNDDGSYNPAKYEDPYKHTEVEDYSGEPQQQLHQQQYQQPQQFQQPQEYQPQDYYQAQQQSFFRPTPPQYRSQQPEQYVTDPKNAAILTEQRYLNGDGKFGASYTQDDGVQFKEEASPDGTRRGSYSYVDPSGQRRTVTYTAGKDGFQASGDHLPVGPAPQPQAAPPQAAYAPQGTPQPAYVPQAGPAYRPQPQAYQQPAYAPPQSQYQPQAYQQAHPNSLPNGNGQYSFDARY